MFRPVNTYRMKACSRCHRALPYSAFHRRRHHVRSGVRAACKECTRQASREARLARPYSPDPTKTRTRWRTRAALLRGLLVRGVCNVCGNASAQAHHLTYDGALAHLMVVWLCPSCHAAAHSSRGWARQLELFPRMSPGLDLSGRLTPKPGLQHAGGPG